MARLSSWTSPPDTTLARSTWGAISGEGSSSARRKKRLPDGSPPPNQVAIYRFCQGQQVLEGYTEPDGGFSFRVGKWPSGLYYVSLVAPDGRIGYAPFVVRPQSFGAGSRIAVSSTSLLSSGGTALLTIIRRGQVSGHA